MDETSRRNWRARALAGEFNEAMEVIEGEGLDPEADLADTLRIAFMGHKGVLKDKAALESKLAAESDSHKETAEIMRRVRDDRASLRAEVERLRDANEHWHTRIEQIKTDHEALQTAHSEACDRVKELEGVLAEVDNRCIDIGADLGRDRIKELEGALHSIAEHDHCYYPDGPTPYGTGVVDGHRCAAKIAKAALRPEPRQEEESDG